MPNLKAKYIIDENGDRVAPITYIDAVRNSSGDSLSDLMVPEKLGSGIGVCSTSSGIALTVSLTGYELVQNGFVAVTFENDVPANATLNINGKGAKPIYYKGAAIEADIIKADDTVMFCYDGTNYVVTSLGGGGGSIVFPEFVTIQLTQSGGSDSDLIGATVVVTNDDTSATILSTTWQGEDISIRIDEGIEYTVTVGNVSNLVIKQNTKSYIAVAVSSRIISFKYWGNAIDMGLPSGLLWARTNIDAQMNNGFAASAFQYNCSFFSWGNVTGHNPISDSAFSYDFGSAVSGPYASTPGSKLTGNIPVDSTYDAARAICGDPWRIPTTAEIKELFDNCDCVQADGTTVITSSGKLVTINGVVGVYLKSKTNGNLLFLSCSGRGEGTSWAYRTIYGNYWSSTLVASDAANFLELNQNFNVPQHTRPRYYGHSIRPVM